MTQMTAILITLFILIWLSFVVAIIGGCVLWIVMLIDLLKRTDWQDENEKILWIVLMLVVGIIAAVVYYFAIYRPRGKAVPFIPTKKREQKIAE